MVESAKHWYSKMWRQRIDKLRYNADCIFCYPHKQKKFFLGSHALCFNSG